MSGGALGTASTTVVEQTSERALIDAARAGDGQALEALLQSHQARVYRFGLRMCQNREDAEDILQDTMLQATRSLADFRGDASLSTWLFAIARSYCGKRRRKSKFAPIREESLEQDGPNDAGGVADSARRPDEIVMAAELRVTLNDAISALDPKHREVLLLRDVEQLRAAEVAEVLGISVAAVKSRLHRARMKVREQLAPMLDAQIIDGRQRTCPDVLSLYAQKIEGAIGPELCAQMEQHLDKCRPCRSECDALKETLALCRGLPAAPVPEPVQIAVRDALRAVLAGKRKTRNSNENLS